MSSKDNTEKMNKLVMVSVDNELISLAKGAIPNTEKQSMDVIGKPVSELVHMMRDLEASALIIDIDAS